MNEALIPVLFHLLEVEKALEKLQEAADKNTYWFQVLEEEIDRVQGILRRLESQMP